MGCHQARPEISVTGWQALRRLRWMAFLIPCAPWETREPLPCNYEHSSNRFSNNDNGDLLFIHHYLVRVDSCLMCSSPGGWFQQANLLPTSTLPLSNSIGIHGVLYLMPRANKHRQRHDVDVTTSLRYHTLFHYCSQKNTTF